MSELLEYQVRDMGDGIYLIKDGFSDYMYVVIGSERAAVIDTGMGVPGLRKIVSKITDKPVIVLNTHAHLDHIGGNDEFDSLWLHVEDFPVYEEHGSFTYRSSVMAKMAEEMQITMAPEFTGAISRSRVKRDFKPLADGQVIALGGVKLEVIHTPGHTKGSVCFYDRERQILFSGDTVCSMGVMLSFPESTSIETFMETIELLKERTKGVKAVYPAHHKVPLDCSYYDKYLECGRQVLAHPKEGEWEESACGRFRRFHYEDISLTYVDCEKESNK